MKRFEIALAVGIFFSAIIGSFSGFAQECEDIRAGALRLHILAHSDSAEDQELKLAVRDAVLAETAELFTQPLTKEQAAATAEAHLDEIAAIAAAEIERRGEDYPVTARVVNRYFETRVYDDFTLPAGHYDAVQLEIGAGAGKNWWCVMFPPMCLPAATETEEDASPLEEQIRAIGEPVRYKPAFAVVEVIEQIQEKLSKS